MRWVLDGCVKLCRRGVTGQRVLAVAGEEV